MSYTTNRQPQGMLEAPEVFLREGMIAELVAINDYSHFINATDNKEVKEIFYHIMEEEKEHYGKFLTALNDIDKEEALIAKRVKEELKFSPKEKLKEEFHGKTAKNNILVDIREAIKGELEAIILYQSFIADLDEEKLISVIKDIIIDEKEHVEELTTVLTMLDRDGYGPLK